MLFNSILFFQQYCVVDYLIMGKLNSYRERVMLYLLVVSHAYTHIHSRLHVHTPTPPTHICTLCLDFITHSAIK